MGRVLEPGTAAALEMGLVHAWGQELGLAMEPATAGALEMGLALE